MTLLIDRRDELGDEPGLHAFVVGVSAYDHLPGGDGTPADNAFGMKQLHSAALTAHSIARWLQERDADDLLYRPLATLRLLLSPSDLEIEQCPELDGLADAANREGFVLAARDWRDDAARHAEGQTLFYFAGHGVYRRHDDAVLLLSDFGNPAAGGPLTNTVEVEHLHFGMAPTSDRPHMALEQLYVVDACRIEPRAFRQHDWMSVPDLWAIELGEDPRSAPIFFGAIPGRKAYGITGDQTLFSRAFLGGLNAGCEEVEERNPESGLMEKQWWVTIHEVCKVLKPAMESLNAEHAVDQMWNTGGSFRDFRLVRLESLPEVEVEVRFLPDAAADAVGLEVQSASGRPVVSLSPPLNPHPWSSTLTRGHYIMATRSGDPARFADTQDIRIVRPPRHVWEVRVGS